MTLYNTIYYWRDGFRNGLYNLLFLPIDRKLVLLTWSLFSGCYLFLNSFSLKSYSLKLSIPSQYKKYVLFPSMQWNFFQNRIWRFCLTPFNFDVCYVNGQNETKSDGRKYIAQFSQDI